MYKVSLRKDTDNEQFINESDFLEGKSCNLFGGKNNSCLE